MRKITLNEFPTNIGLKELLPGKEPGVKKLPDALRKHGFYDLIEPGAIHRLEPPPYKMQLDIESGVLNADAVVTYAIQQEELLENQLKGQNFILSVGGDCSILLGHMLALKNKGRYGLFFIDGHTDYMLPELSSTKAVAGMDLAIATGNGHSKLTNIQDQAPYVDEHDVFCVGNREFDVEYVDAILGSSIHYFDINRLRKTGINNCCKDFLEMISMNELDGFWIHLDLDVLDDEVMPAVDSRSPGGISYLELKEILAPLLGNGKAMGMDITILDPDLDPTGLITDHFIKEMGSFLHDNITTE